MPSISNAPPAAFAPVNGSNTPILITSSAGCPLSVFGAPLHPTAMIENTITSANNRDSFLFTSIPPYSFPFYVWIYTILTH